jgi:hypothetical protein
MIGWSLKITLDDGTEHEVAVTYAVACAWEDHHPGQSMETMVKEVKFKQIAYLAYQACLKAQVKVKAWPNFIDQLGDVDFIPKARTKDKQPDS